MSFLALLLEFGAGFLASSAFEDAMRNPCEGAVPHGWVIAFSIAAVVFAAVGYFIRNSGLPANK